MNCEFCNKIFKTKGILKNHQATAKYCLELRNEESNKWKCMYCEKILTSKHNLETHYEKCVNKVIFNQKDLEIEKLKSENELMKKFYDREIKQKDELINLLHTQIKNFTEKAIEKPNQIFNNELVDNHTTNNNTNNSNNKLIDNRILNMVPMNLTHDIILQSLQQKLNENHIIKGQKGIAEFCIENILITPDQKFLMKCTDPARKVFVYIDEDGAVQKDINANKLTKMISEPVKHISKKILDNFKEKCENSRPLMDDDSDVEVDEMNKEKCEMMENKMYEITTLKNNNSEFVKNLIPPLSS